MQLFQKCQVRTANETETKRICNISSLIVSISVPLTVRWLLFFKICTSYFLIFSTLRALAHWRLKKQLLGPRPLWSATLLSFWGGGGGKLSNGIFVEFKVPLKRNCFQVVIKLTLTNTRCRSLRLLG